MGSCVITGITFTKFVGVAVLAWAPSTLFRLYYFRMYCGIIVCGAFHGLVFLPVLLSLVGPPANADAATVESNGNGTPSKHVEEVDMTSPLLYSGQLAVHGYGYGSSDRNGNSNSNGVDKSQGD